jgi:hypothetical protein
MSFNLNLFVLEIKESNQKNFDARFSQSEIKIYNNTAIFVYYLKKYFLNILCEKL